MKKVAAITICYNEKDKLDLWARHHTKQVGAEHCYIIDHGSDDGTTTALFDARSRPYPGINIIRLPRTPYDNETRTRAIEHFAGFLLRYYDWAFFTDVDELLVADPEKYTSIADFCNQTALTHVTSIGLDVIHRETAEAPLNCNRLVGEQRAAVRFSASMCKQNLVSSAPTWSKGFHTSNLPSQFDAIYLMHLRFADAIQGVGRLGVTRKLDWAQTHEGVHQKVTDDDFVTLLRRMARLPLVEDALKSSEGLLKKYLDRLKTSEKKGLYDKIYNIDLHIFGDELFRLPARFRTAF